MVKMILCCDTGVDDALAIAYAVKYPEVELKAIVASYGVAPVQSVYRNTQKVLKVLKEDIPVFIGSSDCLERTREYSGNFHGDDGLGNILGDVSKEDYVVKHDLISELKEIVNKNEDEVVFVITGPLTTLAQLIVDDIELVKSFKRVIIMGGVLTSPGNVGKYSEANFFMDPEATKIVLESGIPVQIVPLDATRRTLLSKENHEDWVGKASEESLFFAKVIEFYLKAYEKYHPYLDGCALHDPLAVGVAVHPDIIKESICLNLTADTENELGAITENLDKIKEEPTSEVVLRVDVEEFEKDFYELLF